MKKLLTQTIFLLIAIFAGTATTFAITKNDISLQLDGISTQLSGTYSDINEYTDGSGKTFLTTGDIYVKGRLINKTYQDIQLNTSRILVAFVQGDSPYTSTTYSYDKTMLTSLNIEAHGFAEVIVKIPCNYQIRNGKLNLYFVYAEGAGGYFFTGTYNVTNSVTKTSTMASTSENDLRLDLYYISDRGSAGGRLSSYTLDSRNSFVTTTGDIYVSGSITNTTNNPIVVNYPRILVAFGYHESPYTGEVYNGGGDKVSTVTIPAHDYTDIMIKIPTNWPYHLKQTSDNYTYLDFYFIYAEGSGLPLFNGSYCISNGKSKSLSVEKQLSITVSYYDASNVTVKSTDDSAIKSIRVIGTMGDLVKSQSYGNNSMEANIDLSNCKNGIYYIQVEKTTGVETSKIIKK